MSLAHKLKIPEDSETMVFGAGKRDVRLTNLQKTFWPELGITKGQLIQYYADISQFLLPHLRDRAMVMKRYPHGYAGTFFFMKRTPSPRPEWLQTCSIEHASGNVIDFPLRLSPATTDISIAKKWFGTVGSALDGVVAKRLDLDYRSGERTGMVKVKRLETVDCVVGGFRYATGKRVVGSLLLGLYDNDGLLHHVGFTSGIKTAERKDLTIKLESFIEAPGFTGHAPGGPSRWSTERSAEWVPLAPQLVVEVSYDHVTNGRFRHGTRLIRWRPDKNPRQCTMEQIRRGKSRSLMLLDKAS